jgi:hypothetical protein
VITGPNHVGWRRSLPDGVASGIRCKSAGAGSGFMIRLCGGSDSFWLIIGLGHDDSVWPQLAGWFEQRAAQVLEQAQAQGLSIVA